MTEYEHDWELTDVNPPDRSLFWRGYVLGLLTVVVVVGGVCMSSGGDSVAKRLILGALRQNTKNGDEIAAYGLRLLGRGYFAGYTHAALVHYVRSIGWREDV